jgi:hypothetical protein
MRLAQTSKKSAKAIFTDIVLHLSHNKVNATRALQGLSFSGIRVGLKALIVNSFTSFLTAGQRHDNP